MKFSVLGSGSEGNAIYVEFSSGAAILIDAGLSPAELDRRLLAIGVIGHSHIEALYLTHDHGDHGRYLDALKAKWKVRTPGDAIPQAITHRVDAFRVPHDAVAPVGFTIRDAECRLVIILDAGWITPTMDAEMKAADALVIGCDYDEAMLEANETYPAETKNRIASATGHLSNQQVAAWVRENHTFLPRVIVLAHISKVNNSHHLASLAVVEAMGSRTNIPAGYFGCSVEVSHPEHPTDLIEVESKIPKRSDK